MKNSRSSSLNTIDPPELGRVSVKLFLAISEDWNLKEAERLTLAGLASKATLHQWRHKVAKGEGIKLSKDTLERLSYIAGIRKGVELLAPKEQWAELIRKPNRDFGNSSALDRMLGGQVMDLAEVHRYFDGLRGAHFA